MREQHCNKGGEKKQVQNERKHDMLYENNTPKV